MSATAAITVVDATITAITLTSDKPGLSIGQQAQLTATATLNAGAPRVLTDAEWISQQPQIASVSDQGLVTALSSGSVTFTAEEDNVIGTITLEITALQSINVQITDSVIADKTYTAAKAFGVSTDSTVSELSDVDWTSSNEQVVTVDATGLIEAVGAGSATISATKDNITSNLAAITVTDAVISAIEIDERYSRLPIGFSKPLSATLILSDGTTQPAYSATWSSSDDAVAEIVKVGRKSKLKALALSTVPVTVTAEFAGLSSTFDVNMVDLPVASIAFNKDALILPKNATAALSVIATFDKRLSINITEESTFVPSNLGDFATANDQAVNFTAGDTPGIETLTAQYESLSATLAVEVTSAEPVKLVTSYQDQGLPIGYNETITVSVEYSDGTFVVPQTNNVLWSVSDAAIASLSSSGTATANLKGLALGTVTLSVTANNLSLDVSVEITAATPLSVTFTVPTIYEGDKPVKLQANMTFSDTFVRDVTKQVLWSSSDKLVATVSNNAVAAGTLSPVSSGDVSITASYGSSSVEHTEVVTILQPRLISGFTSYAFAESPFVSIGEGDYEIQLDFSNIDSNSVSVVGGSSAQVGISENTTFIAEINDAELVVTSASAINLVQNSNQSVAVAKNANNVYAVIQLHHVEDFRTNASDGDLVFFSWAIRTDGGKDFSDYAVENELMLFKCEDPKSAVIKGKCTELSFSYNSQVSTNINRDPRPDEFSLAEFLLISIGQSHTVTDVSPVFDNNNVGAYFGGLVNDQLIPIGYGIPFRLMVPATNGATVDNTFSFNVDNNTSKTFLIRTTFTSN